MLSLILAIPVTTTVQSLCLPSDESSIIHELINVELDNNKVYVLNPLNISKYCIGEIHYSTFSLGGAGENNDKIIEKKFFCIEEDIDYWLTSPPKSITIRTTNKFDNNNSLSDLNNAFTNKCFKILVKKGYKLAKPLIIYHSTNSKIWSKNINLRLDFELDKDSSLRIVDLFNDTSEKNFLNIFYNFDLKENAVLKNYKVDKLKNKNIKYSFNNIEQDKNSISETFILSSGSNFVKNEINCNLKGEHSSAFVNGIFSLNDNQHHEIRTIINHLTENTKSYQLIKSVLDQNSKAVYQGKIFVNSEAQKTDGYQLSKAILLKKDSEFNAKPELEIYADDVKCSHGSASGSLNDDSIFYLMSRGLNYQQSRELLINGFLLDVVEKITDSEIKNLIKNMIGIKE